LPKASRSSTNRTSGKNLTKRAESATDQRVSSEEAIRAGEQIAMAAFASGLKLAAAFGTVAAKTAGLALASLASGADKFSELVKEEALRSYDGNGARTRSKSARSRKAGSKRRNA
jgi:Na+(H+)/acetate symporter ActP